jgi:predicted transcriptional regulator
MSQVAERTHIGAYVTPEQRQQLVELAQRDDRSVSSVIRIALAEHLERERAAPTTGDT